MTTQECKCEDKNTDYHLKVCCSKINSPQEQLERIIEYYIGSLIPDRHKKDFASAIFSAIRVDEGKLEAVLEENISEYLDLDGFPQGKGYKNLTEFIASHAQEIIKFEAE